MTDQPPRFTSDQPQFTFAERSDPFARLPALAERLGVRETTDMSGWFVMTKAGHKYSIFDLINAALDRLDIAVKPAVMVGCVRWHRNGKPLTAGEIPPDATVWFNRETGEVTAIEHPPINNNK